MAFQTFFRGCERPQFPAAAVPLYAAFPFPKHKTMTEHLFYAVRFEFRLSHSFHLLFSMLCTVRNRKTQIMER